MKILVTGGAGRIGRLLVAKLSEKRHEVAVLGRESDVKPPEAEKMIVSNICEKNTLDKASREKYDVVYHLAAYLGREPRECIDTNITGTLNVLECFKAPIIFTSTSLVYGDPAQKKISEDFACLPIDAYGASKLAAEHLIRVLAPSHLILRIFNVYGNGFQSSTVNQFAEKAALGEDIEVFGKGTHERDYIHVDDLLDALVLALDKTRLNETINIGAGTGTSTNELAEKTIKISRSRSKIRRVPYDISKIGHSRYADISKAKKLLGWTPQTSLDKGIKRLLSQT